MAVSRLSWCRKGGRYRPRNISKNFAGWHVPRGRWPGLGCLLAAAWCLADPGVATEGERNFFPECMRRPATQDFEGQLADLRIMCWNLHARFTAPVHKKSWHISLPSSERVGWTSFGLGSGRLALARIVFSFQNCCLVCMRGHFAKKHSVSRRRDDTSFWKHAFRVDEKRVKKNNFRKC